MNINVLEKAPCSVGILIDRGVLGGSVSMLASRYICHVAVIFIGGVDDTKALAHGSRMARHPSVDLTVARFLLFGEENSKDRKRDSDLLEEYRVANGDNERFVVVEEVGGTIRTLHFFQGLVSGVSARSLESSETCLLP
ncbi:hypothetical protein GBA52_024373 [Prunus armeniaca]|nr:hypothetical protein GBA52_024373 [Prunus armeniaca]